MKLYCETPVNNPSDVRVISNMKFGSETNQSVTLRNAALF